jgi:hypothetical protein
VSFFLFLPAFPVEQERKWRTKLLSYPNAKPRKIAELWDDFCCAEDFHFAES